MRAGSTALAGTDPVAGVPQGESAARADALVTVHIDGCALAVARGTLVAAALELGQPGRGARLSPGAQRRQAFCGMGICGECRVEIDGRAHVLGCQVACAPGMEIRTDG